MWRRFRPPLIVVTGLLFGLVALLAVLQYWWLGQISEAERDRLRNGLTTGAGEFARDFDREIALAFLLFQIDGPELTDTTRTVDRFGAQFDRWQSTARFPKLIKEFYRAEQENGTFTLRRFDQTQRTLSSVDWPTSMAGWQDHLAFAEVKESNGRNGLFVRRMPLAIWEEVPAVVVPTPMIFAGSPPGHMAPALSYAILAIDLDYVSKDLLPALAARHFSASGSDVGYRVAVLSTNPERPAIFQSTPGAATSMDAPADVKADLLQLRPQDFAGLAAEVRRFSALAGGKPEAVTGQIGHRFSIAESRPPLSLVITSRTDKVTARDKSAPAPVGVQAAVSGVFSTGRLASQPPPAHWTLIVTHPLGSLDAAVTAQRRRNIAISSSVLGLLATSMGLLVLSTRRSQRLARQQMEFVAAVSHELRTPLAVIRSAADNLADGVIEDTAGIRRYGELMSAEGRRLSEMVEQILELAGIQSGQRGFALRPIDAAALLRDIASASAGLIERAGLKVEFDLPDDLPPMLGDEAALRRVFQNLLDNAIKYGAPIGAASSGGASSGWVRLSASRSGADVSVTVADGGIGIEPADLPKIFEPFYRASKVIDAQMPGAGLGLSLVHRIVVAHGGRVTVKSTPGAGSEFTVTVPAAGRQAAVIPAAAEQTPRSVEAPRYS
jgi:signal transduction histidine kinase